MIYRESVDSLNYKFDENSSINSSTNNTCNNSNFRMSLNDLNKEFFDLDNEFSANNWADMQSEDVREEENASNASTHILFYKQLK